MLVQKRTDECLITLVKCHALGDLDTNLNFNHDVIFSVFTVMIFWAALLILKTLYTTNPLEADVDVVLMVLVCLY